MSLHRKVNQRRYLHAIMFMALLLLSGCQYRQLGEKNNSQDSIVGRDGSIEGSLESSQELVDNLKIIQQHNKAVLEERSPEKAVMQIPEPTGKGIIQSIELQSDSVVSSKTQMAPSLALKEALSSEKRTRVEMDFKEVDLQDLLQIFFEEFLKEPYTFLDDFRDQKVGLVYRASATKAEILGVLESFLTFHGVSLAYGNGIYAISKSLNKKKGQPAKIPFGSGVGIYKLQYIGTRDFINVVRQFLDQPGNAIELNGLNTIFVNASYSQLKAIQSLFEQLDIPYFDGKHLLVYDPKYLSAAAMKVLIEKYEKTIGAAGKLPVRLIESEVIKEHNRLIIISANKTIDNILRQFLAITDKPSSNAKQIFQYILTNQKANEVIGTIKNLVNDLLQKRSEINIVADKASNSLFVSAGPAEYAEVLSLIKRIDSWPPAVHVDLTVAEVVLTDRMKYGVEWYLFQRKSNKSAEGLLNLSVDTNSRGLNLSLLDIVSDKFAAIDLLASETKFDVIANPQILVKNGSTAKLVVGSEIAIEKANLKTDTSGSSTQTEFERRDVALSLEVTPMIGANQQIQLSLKLKDERFITRDINNQPVFTKREIMTDLVAYDGETVLLGGIIRTTRKHDNNKIPFIGDLPFIGNAFKNLDNEVEKTELIILVTPRLILDRDGSNAATKAVLKAIASMSAVLAESPPEAELTVTLEKPAKDTLH